MFFFAVIVLALAVVAGVLGFKGKYKDHRGNESTQANKILKWSSLGGIVLAAVIAVPTMVYTQDPGQAKVLRSWTGEVVGQSMGEGLKFKEPWVEVIDYDIRNQQVVFANSTGKEPQDANGPQITVQDREGVTANIDITVRYSINPEAVSDIYKKYLSQENFIHRFIENDIRAGVRTIPAEYGTLELLNNRAEVETKIHEYLADRWEKQGVRAESVSLQEIRYSDDVKQRFDDAQASRIRVEQARAELEATEVSAQQKVVQAEAEASANRTLAESLTDPILRQRYLDTLKELAQAGNLVITDGNSNVLIQK